MPGVPHASTSWSMCCKRQSGSAPAITHERSAVKANDAGQLTGRRRGAAPAERADPAGFGLLVRGDVGDDHGRLDQVEDLAQGAMAVLDGARRLDCGASETGAGAFSAP